MANAFADFSVIAWVVIFFALIVFAAVFSYRGKKGENEKPTSPLMSMRALRSLSEEEQALFDSLVQDVREKAREDGVLKAFGKGAPGGKEIYAAFDARIRKAAWEGNDAYAQELKTLQAKIFPDYVPPNQETGDATSDAENTCANS